MKPRVGLLAGALLLAGVLTCGVTIDAQQPNRLTAREVSVVDSSGTARVWIVARDEAAFLQMNDQTGQTRLLLRVDAQGNPTINIRDASGRLTSLPQQRANVGGTPRVGRFLGGKLDRQQITQADIDDVWLQIFEILGTLDRVTAELDMR